MDRTPFSPLSQEYSTPDRRRTLTEQLFSGWFRSLVPALAESLFVAWWMLFLLELYRPGLVSTVWDLNLLLFFALVFLVVGLLVGSRTGKVHSLVAIISAILVALYLWQLLGNSWWALIAILAGVVVFFMFKYTYHD
ncbi:MAG: hypothetical protein ABIJ81_02050 [Patescibacteria group bacterium]